MIVIDPGHGGVDAGAVANGIQEKDWVLEISLYQFNRLKELGVPVRLTRHQDDTLSPKERAAFVKKSGALYCISNHFNAGGGEGVETIHSIFSRDTLAKECAEAIHKAGQPLRRAFSKKGQNGYDYYFMHRDTGKVETVIVEYGFLDNVRDFARLKNKDYRLTLAEAVVQVLARHYLPSHISQEKISSKIYTVQIGAFKQKTNAENLVKELKIKGYDAFIK
ncbi:N-acetylmuramoyl-L-alanine amidase [Massilibacterium senegalense]|uniref:N-acetylmuramoyl-L-alanine amidase n=1 Tax=Massilibacterium senegalense TaxID=1632858 RepID=UPI0007854E3B|nr:N-acetylmuramoyl-L-alanine amidase [Massilibacterium senegalense]